VLEATFRKTGVPVVDNRLAVSHHMLADPLDYQHAAVRQALDPETLRPTILLADAVGPGKMLETGMTLSESVRRGRPGHADQPRRSSRRRRAGDGRVPGRESHSHRMPSGRSLPHSPQPV